MKCEKKREPLAEIIILLLFAAGLFLPISAPAESGPEYGLGVKQPIAGKWLRPDGGYVLELSEVKEDGTLKAAYFNPRSIHVAKAEWRRIGDRIQVFVKLQDINYPGSTYTLIYDPKEDRFTGYYYQAARNQTFDVVFIRRK